MLAAAQVVDAIATRITGLALTGSRVYTSRAWPLAEKDLPAWRVVAHDEDVEPVTVHRDPVQAHALQVELYGLTQVAADLDDALNALASQALAAIFRTSGVADALDAFDGKLQVSLRRVERSLAKEGEAAVGLVLVTLRANFRTRASAPDSLI